MEALATLGIDWKLLIAQIINFIILLAILYKFLYGPIVSMLESRAKRIQKSLKQADEIEKNWEQAKTKEEELLNKARAESKAIIEETRVIAEKEGKLLKEKTKQEIEQLVLQAKEQIKGEKQKMSQELNKEVAGLVIEATQKVLGKHASSKELDKKLIDEVLAGIKV